MKLFKKLLPVAAIGSVAAVVTPLVTSCGSDYFCVNGYSRYIPTIAQATPKQQQYTPTQAAEQYFDEIIADEDVLIQDFQASISNNAYSQIGDVSGDSKPTCNIQTKFSDVSLTKRAGSTTCDLSFKLDANIKSNKLKFGFSKQNKKRYDADLSISLKATDLEYVLDCDNGVCSFIPGDFGYSKQNIGLEATANGILCMDDYGPATWFKFNNETFILASSPIPVKWETLAVFCGTLASAEFSYHLATLNIESEN